MMRSGEARNAFRDLYVSKLIYFKRYDLISVSVHTGRQYHRNCHFLLCIAEASRARNSRVSHINKHPHIRNVLVDFLA